MYSVCIVNTSSLCIFNADKTSRIAKAVVNGVVVGGLAVVQHHSPCLRQASQLVASWQDP